MEVRWTPSGVRRFWDFTLLVFQTEPFIIKVCLVISLFNFDVTHKFRLGSSRHRWVHGYSVTRFDVYRSLFTLIITHTFSGIINSMSILTVQNPILKVKIVAIT